MKRNILLTDDLAKIKVKMWEPLADEEFKVGNIVRLTTMHIDVHTSQTCVSSGDHTSYEVQLFPKPKPNHNLQTEDNTFTVLHEQSTTTARTQWNAIARTLDAFTIQFVILQLSSNK